MPTFYCDNEVCEIESGYSDILWTSRCETATLEEATDIICRTPEGASGCMGLDSGCRPKVEKGAE